jgi:hypothetical protein
VIRPHSGILGRPASESPLDCISHIIAQFLSSLQSSLYPHEFQFASCDLTRRLLMVTSCIQAALMTDGIRLTNALCSCAAFSGGLEL